VALGARRRGWLRHERGRPRVFIDLGQAVATESAQPPDEPTFVPRAMPFGAVPDDGSHARIAGSLQVS
jgi:hypothetical protein